MNEEILFWILVFFGSVASALVDPVALICMAVAGDSVFRPNKWIRLAVICGVTFILRTAIFLGLRTSPPEWSLLAGVAGVVDVLLVFFIVLGITAINRKNEKQENPSK